MVIEHGGMITQESSPLTFDGSTFIQLAVDSFHPFSQLSNGNIERVNAEQLRKE
jgi:hypothetical protein